MISQLSGRLLDKTDNLIVLDVNGVGYEVELTMGTFFSLPAVGELTTICTHFIVREDAMLLYGFRDQSERSLFRELLRVSGIGPKVALGILSSVEPQELVQCVRNSNTLMLTQIPGIGKKTAERLVIELRDRLQQWVGSDATISVATEKPTDASSEKLNQH